MLLFTETCDSTQIFEVLAKMYLYSNLVYILTSLLLLFCSCLMKRKQSFHLQLLFFFIQNETDRIVSYNWKVTTSLIMHKVMFNKVLTGKIIIRINLGYLFTAKLLNIHSISTLLMISDLCLNLKHFFLSLGKHQWLQFPYYYHINQVVLCPWQ